MGPLVSVIIRTYNRAHFICEAIDSVLNQTFRDFEIIVADDGSTDNTREVIKKYKDKIIYVYQSNKGASSLTNTGIRASKGKYIALLDSDDIWLPEKLELQVEMLEHNPELTLVYADSYRFDKFNTPYENFFQLFKNTYEGDVFNYLLIENFTPFPTVIIKKDCLERVGLFDESLLLSYDYDMWLRIARYFKFGCINKPLAKYRLHENNLSKNSEGIYRDRIKLFKKIIDCSPNLSEKQCILINKKLASQHFNLGCELLKKGKEITEIRQHTSNSIMIYPLGIRKYILFFMTFLPFSLINKVKEKVLTLLFGND